MNLQIGDLVTVPHRGAEIPGLIVNIHHYQLPGMDEVWCDMRTVRAGTISAPATDVRAVETRPAAGQRWQCIAKPNLVLTVDSVTGGGLFADCRTESGRWVGDVALIGFYRLAGVAS